MLDTKPRLQLMIDKLYEQIQKGFIDDQSWECKFVLDIRERLKMNFNLSQKQIEKLEEIFERN